jgi:hypothetical protein
VDLILENHTTINRTCKGALRLVESSTGEILKSIAVTEYLTKSGVSCQRHTLDCSKTISEGCYDVKFIGESNSIGVCSKPIRVAVVKSTGKLVKGNFPQRNRAFYTMTIGNMDRRSAKKLSALGFDVAYFQPKWSSVETSPNTYDFSVYDGAITTASTEGLATAIGSVTWTTSDYGPNYGIPNWITGKMVSRLGSSVTDGTIFDNTYMNSVVTYWKALAKHTAGMPSVVSYVPTGPGNDHMLNFGGGIYGVPGHLYDYSSYAAARWSEWLETDSGYSLSSLKTELGMNLKSYSDVPMPKYKSDYGALLWCLWMEFRRDRVKNSWERMAAAIREEDPAVAIELKHSGGWLSWGNMQGSYFDETIDVAAKYGGSLLKTASEWTDQFIVPAPLAAHRNVPLGAEMAILPPPREAFQMAMFNLMTYRGNQAVYVYWEVGEPTYNWAEYKPFMDRVLAATLVSDNICLIYSTWATLTEGIVEKSEVDSQRREMWGDLLANHSVRFDVTTDQEPNFVLSKYPVIINSNSGKHPDAYWDKLESYVRKGGVLILPYLCGSSDNYSFQRNVLGVGRSGKAKGKIIFTGKHKAIADYNSDDGYELAAKRGKIIASWENKKTAAVEIPVEQGTPPRLGFPLAKYTYDEKQGQSVWSIVKELLGMYGVRPSVEAPPLLQTSLFEEKGESYLFLAFNHDIDSSDGVSLCLPGTGSSKTCSYIITNLLTGQKEQVQSMDGKVNFKMLYRSLTTEVFSIKAKL